MKTHFILYSLLFMIFSFGQKKQENFKTEIDFGNGTVFSTFLEVVIVKDKFTITSPKDADVRILGSKAKMGRMLGKLPKKGIFLTIKGECKTDALAGDAVISMMGEFKFTGVVKNNALSGKLLKEDGTILGSIEGVASTEKKNAYNSIYPILIKQIQNHIYSDSVLKTKEWSEFKMEMEKLCNNATDDIELFIGFNIHRQKLPFSHLNLIISKDEDDDSELSGKTVVFEEKNKNTAYLLIKDFSNSKEELEVVFPKIIGNYMNLVVDLRNNPGGGIESAVAFANYIFNTDTQVGYFVTNKLQYTSYQPEIFSNLPELQPETTDEFIEDLKNTSGAKLVFKRPNNPVFTGTIYVLTNSKTGSTCEPIVYLLKNSKRALIVGEKTAGAMLAATSFDLYGKYKIILPIADFFTYDGNRLDNVGVNPDIEVKSEDALQKVLELIDNH